MFLLTDNNNKNLFFPTLSYHFIALRGRKPISFETAIDSRNNELKRSFLTNTRQDTGREKSMDPTENLSGADGLDVRMVLPIGPNSKKKKHPHFPP
jgi:hypothetical protein